MSELISRPSAIKAAVTTALTSVLLCCACATASAAPFFSPASPWNASLSANAALDADSDGLVAELNRQVTAYGPWINSNQFSVPVYTVPEDQPGVPVHIDYPSDMYTNRADASRLEQELDGIPIPRGARPAAGTDQHMVVWQPSTDTMWELWQARDVDAGDLSSWRDNRPGWHASWGARIDHASQADGVNPAPYGATASGLALAGGLITQEELHAGRIDHALALAIPDVARGRFTAPATRTDGKYTGPDAITEGTRFRLPADLDIDRLGLAPVPRMMAVAAQKYGILVRDGAGAVTFYTEDPVPTGDFVFRQLLGPQNPARALGSFPWSKLQAVSPVQPDPPAPPAEDPPADPPTPPVSDPPADVSAPPLPAPPLPAPPLPAPPLPAPPLPAPSISVQSKQRIAKALRRGVRIRCITRAGGRCKVRVTTGRRVLFSGSGGAAIVTARATAAGRRMLAGARRQAATLQVTGATGTQATRRLTFVR